MENAVGAGSSQRAGAQMRENFGMPCVWFLPDADEQSTTVAK
jgi:hypothetical protein